MRGLDLDELYRDGLKALERGRYRKALVFAREARRRHNTMAYEIEARARWGLGERQRALDLIREGARRYPSLPVLWGYYGEFASEMGQYDDATAAFMRAGEAGSSPCNVDYNLGVIAFRRNRLDEAVRYYRSALAAFDPWSDEGYTADMLNAEAGCALTKLRRHDEAEAALRSVDPSKLSPKLRRRAREAWETLRGH